MAGFSVVAHGAACQRRHELRILPAVNFRRSRDAIKAPRLFCVPAVYGEWMRKNPNDRATAVAAENRTQKPANRWIEN